MRKYGYIRVSEKDFERPQYMKLLENCRSVIPLFTGDVRNG